MAKPGAMAYDRALGEQGRTFMSEIYDFDREIERRDTNSAKWEKYRGRDILPMWVADSDFAVAPPIVEAMHRRVDHPVYGYSHTAKPLQELIAARMQRLYDWQVAADWVVMLPGIVGALHLACRATGQPGEGAYVPQVIYPPFSKAPSFHGMHNLTMPMTWRDERLLLDLDWLERQPAKPGQILLFCNPQNPGGTCYRRDELERLVALVEDRQWILCSDEVHCDLVLEAGLQHVPAASLGAGIEQRSITLMAPSKTFNLAGLGCAFAIVPEPKLRKAMTTNPYIVPHVNVIGLAAAEAAYRHCDEWNRQQCVYLAANRDLLRERINRLPGLKLGPVEATYLAWIDVSGLGLDDPPAFFEAAGIGMSPGKDFGDSDYMRLNFACPRSRLELAIERIERAVEAHQN